MGAQNTKTESVVGHLSHEECLTLRKLFNSFSSGGQGVKGEKGINSSYRDFQRHCEGYLDDWLAQRVADRLSVKSTKGDELIVPLTKYLHFVSNLLKGSTDEKVDVVWDLALNASPTQPREFITSQEITQYIRSIIESYLKCVEKGREFVSWKGAPKATSDSISDFAEFLLSDLLYKNVGGKELIKQRRPSKQEHSKEDLVNCFSKSSLLLSLHNSIISQCFSLDTDSYFVQLLPLCLKAQSAFIPEDFSVLDLSRVLFLNSQLPSELRSEWRYLFSTPTHGESFSKFLGQVVDKGPTLIIIRDEKQRIFGAFATHSWATGPKFFGEDQCFFFHLSPKFAIYSSTGYNQNYQYMNVQQQTLPNGLGMGGKFGYFGLWIDAEFGQGKGAPTCTTFSSPQLPTNEEFSVHHLEVWGVGPEPKKDENDRDSKSILDKDPEAKAMLEMINKGTHSDGYREEPKD